MPDISSKFYSPCSTELRLSHMTLSRCRFVCTVNMSIRVYGHLHNYMYIFPENMHFIQSRQALRKPGSIGCCMIVVVRQGLCVTVYQV